MKVKWKLKKSSFVEVEVTDEKAEFLIELKRWEETHERKFKRRTLIETSFDNLRYEYGWEPRDESVDVQGTLEREDEAERVRQAVGCLSAKQREVVRLYFYEQKTMREIAAIFGIDHSSVVRQIETIKKKLKKIL